MSSLKVGPLLLHGTSAAIMAYGFLNLGNMPTGDLIKQQKGGHFQFLTIQGLVVALLTMTFSFAYDVLPTMRVFKAIKRSLLMLALPLAVVISTIYWSLFLFAPHLILRKAPENELTSSGAVPAFVRIPLHMDLALHAVPGASLLIDFIFAERKYSKNAALYGGMLLVILAGASYANWVEYVATFNGMFPYPFLTENPFNVRVMIYAAASTFALVTFWILNALHP